MCGFVSLLLLRSGAYLIGTWETRVEPLGGVAPGSKSRSQMCLGVEPSHLSVWPKVQNLGAK